MNRGRKAICTLFLSALLISLIPSAQVRNTSADNKPSILIVNPGPESYPSGWNASSNARDLGTPNFTFYSNETSADSTFFINLTVSEVKNLYGWMFGIVYDNTSLQFVRAWLPIDHVFKGAADLGYTIIQPTVWVRPVDTTHTELLWAASYIMGDTDWTFNGTGTLAQMEFKIVRRQVSTSPPESSYFTFDPEWTSAYYWPEGQEIPLFNQGFFRMVVVGDVNSDGKVDMSDINTVVAAFGAFSVGGHTHPRYNGVADLNGDGMIAMGDLITVLMNFGQAF